MKITAKLPQIVTEPLRFIRDSDHRRRIIREASIRREQDRSITRYDNQTRKLIVFLIGGPEPSGKEKISGGIMSIVSLCEESAELKTVTDAEVIMCTMRHEPLIFHHRQFANKTEVFRFAQLAEYFPHLEEVIFHLPEYNCQYFLDHLLDKDRKWLAGLRTLHINILNQNILLMPTAATIASLKQTATRITVTTAHQRYCNPKYRQQYGVSLHKLSVWISPEKYRFTGYAEKENLIVVSPDSRPLKEKVLEKLTSIEGLSIQVIQGLTYEQYKETIARAKWTLTFGEGLDAYIIEPIFSGAIGFAVYNEDFFTPDFKGLPTIYGSYETLLDTIVADIRRLDHQESFNACQRQQFDLCASYYSFEEYRRNILKFYKGEYTLP